MNKRGFLGGVGSVEIQTITVSSGNTSKTVTFNSPHGADVVVIGNEGWAATSFYISGITSSGCTVTFSDPGGNSQFQLIIAG